MEVIIIEDKKKKLVFDLKGEGHTLCNALREELWNDNSVSIAAYNIAHPLVGVPRFMLETDGKKEPKKALQDAIKRLKKKNADLRKELKVLK